MDSKKGKPFLTIVIAVLVLFGLSFVPWSKITGGYIKDFNLLSDIMKTTDSTVVTAAEPVDPELEKAVAEMQTPSKARNSATSSAHEDSVAPVAVKAAINPREGDNVIIEDYTPGGTGLANLKRALGQRTSRPVRVAVIGDSYIEGDILTMNIREALQDKYGGSGVGYMPLSSELTGFRTSVRQTCSGWTEHDIRKKSSKLKSLSGEYFTSTAGAKSTYKGTSKLRHLSNWNSTKFLFISPNPGTVTITTDNGTNTFDVTGSEDVQCLSVDGTTASATVETDINGLNALGLYINDNSGITVDNMSLRGNSGITHRNLDTTLAAGMRPYADYDLIIVEYGINALSSQQKEYMSYGRLMEQTVRRLKECYPNADILLMGIGDRGQKINGTVASLPTSQAMVNAQREAARNTGVLFWDTREAMGGENAVVSWRENGYINADYIHLNARGGAALSKEFMKSLNLALQK